MRTGAAQRGLGLAGVAILVVFLASVGTMASEPGSHAVAPPEILASAREYAISKVGEAFFTSYMTVQLSRFVPVKVEDIGRPGLPDWCRHSRYEVVYYLDIPDKPWVHVPCVVNIREDGGWFVDPNPYEGLPDCVSDPGECEFRIDRDAAVEIARDAGLEPGAGAWRTLFSWGGRAGTYVWDVYNTLPGTGGGRGIVIDANSGKVLGESSRSVTP